MLVLIGIIAAAASGSQPTSVPASSVPGDPAPAGDSDAVKDVRIDSCQVDTNTFGTTSKVRVTITNHTNQTQSYLATISINDASGSTRYGEGTATTNSLGAGQTTVLDAPGFLSAKPAAGFTCAIARVDRLPV